MGLFSAFAAPFMNSFLGVAQKPQQEPPGFQDSGWTDQRPGPTVPDPALDPEEPMSKWKKVDQALGSNIGKAATSIAGGFISDFRQRKNTKKHHRFLRGQGLTPQEIAGGGGAGGAVSSQGNTLGSGPAQQVTQQLEYQRTQARLERANKLKIARLSAGPGHRGVDVQEQRLMLERLITAKQLAQFDANLEKIKAIVRRQDFDLENYWPTKFAAMGPDNGMFALAAYSSGISLERVLRAQGDMSPVEARQVQALYNDFLKIKSSFGKETLGMVGVLKQLIFGQDSLTKEDATQSLGRHRRQMKDNVKTWKDNNPRPKKGATGKW